MGGEALPVEVVPMQGKAKLTLTGSLGEVLRESATAALSYIRNHGRLFGLKEDFFESLEIHVHIPEGAVPKDGPSAGITTDIAMTGEITLTGDVLPVGGLNEKLLAAKRLGIYNLILPNKNRKDITELPSKLLEGLHLHYVKTIKEVIKLTMTESPFTGASHKTRRRTGIALNR